MIKRVELLVYFNYRSSIPETLTKLGATVQYLNKKLGYAVLYVDDDKMKNVTNGLRHMKGFKKYEISPQELPEIPIDK